MNTITTYFDKPVNFVITDGEGRVIANVPVNAGNQDITKTVCLAIADDKGEEVIGLETDLLININSSLEEIDFEVELKDEVEAYTQTFYLTRTESYDGATPIATTNSIMLVPVSYVNAKAFCSEINKQTFKKFTDLTEKFNELICEEGETPESVEIIEMDEFIYGLNNETIDTENNFVANIFIHIEL